MRNRRTRLGVSLVAAVFVFALPAMAADKAAPTPPSVSPEEQAMMEKWQEFATPGDPHKLLASKVGTWTGAVKMWMTPGGPVQEAVGTTKAEMIMDGRFLKDVTEGDFGGQPFRGQGLTGYDNLKKKYIGSWIDNMGTGIMTSEGTYDAATKSFHYTTEGPNFMTGKYEPARTVEKLLGPDKYVMEMFANAPDGKEYKCMEIVFTRAK